MNVDEFKEQILPVVEELKEYCSYMSEYDFSKFKGQAMEVLPIDHQGVQHYLAILFSYLNPKNKG